MSQACIYVLAVFGVKQGLHRLEAYCVSSGEAQAHLLGVLAPVAAHSS